MKRYFLNIFAVAVIAVGAASSAFGAGTTLHPLNTCSGGGGSCQCGGGCSGNSGGRHCNPA